MRRAHISSRDVGLFFWSEGNLEQQFDSKLDLSASGCGAGYYSCGWAYDRNRISSGCGGALGGASREDGGLRSLQVGVVEYVEELGAELGANAFRDLRGLRQRKVEVCVVRPGKAVAAKIAHCTIGGCRNAPRLKN